MIEKNKLFLSLLLMGTLNTIETKTGDDEGPNSFMFDPNNYSSDDDESVDDETQSTTQNQDLSQTKTSLITYWSIQGINKGVEGFGSGLGTELAKTLITETLTRFDCLKTKRMRDLERIHRRQKKAELALTQNQKDLTTAQKTAADAQTRSSDAQTVHTKVLTFKELISAPTAQQVRTKKRIEEERQQSQAKYEREQALHQEQLRQKAELDAIAAGYAESIKAYNTIHGTPEKKYEEATVWKNLLGNKYDAQEAFFKEEMRQTLYTKNVQNAVDRTRNKKRLKKQLEELNIEVDEQGFVKEKVKMAQLAAHAADQKDIASNELSDFEKQYDSYMQKADQELNIQHNQATFVPDARSAA